MEDAYEIYMSMAVFEFDLFHITVPWWLVDSFQYFGKWLSVMTPNEACAKQSIYYAGVRGAVVLS